jgi:hypothetical protein
MRSFRFTPTYQSSAKARTYTPGTRCRCSCRFGLTLKGGRCYFEHSSCACALISKTIFYGSVLLLYSLPYDYCKPKSEFITCFSGLTLCIINASDL